MIIILISSSTRTALPSLLSDSLSKRRAVSCCLVLTARWCYEWQKIAIADVCYTHNKRIHTLYSNESHLMYAIVIYFGQSGSRKRDSYKRWLKFGIKIFLSLTACFKKGNNDFISHLVCRLLLEKKNDIIFHSGSAEQSHRLTDTGSLISWLYQQRFEESSRSV